MLFRSESEGEFRVRIAQRVKEWRDDQLERVRDKPAAKLASLVTEFADTGTNLTMRNYFAKGAKVSPAEHKKYIARSYKIEGSPKVDGDQAKASVKITGVDSGKEEGTLEWKFAKEKEIWKIAEAPLP